jgi:hypothetical protein
MSTFTPPLLDAAAVALVAALGVIVRLLWRHSKRLGQMLDDWHGDAGRPGVQGRPGVMLRLLTLEESVGEIRYEVKPNGGQSMRDDVRVIREVTSGEQQQPGETP